MIVAVDARSLEEQRTGIGRYLQNLLREFAVLRPDWTFRIYTIGPPQPDAFLQAPCFEPRRVSFEAPGQVDIFQAELERDPPDVFFSPLYELPRPIDVPCVITVHDMVHEATPEAFTDVQLTYLRDRHAYALRRADRIITDSQFARTEILSRFPDVDPVVIPLAADPRFRPLQNRSALSELKEKLPWENPFAHYFLYVGSISAKRHVVELAQSYLASVFPNWGVPLVLVGHNYLPEPKVLHQLLAHPCIRHFDWLPDDELLLLYQGATAFIYLSTYEGFGMPPLEAMACGVPVVAARAASVPEVVGDAALLVDDPTDVRAVRRALQTIYLTDWLRALLKTLGILRSSEFSWKKTAHRTLDVIASAPR